MRPHGSPKMLEHRRLKAIQLFKVGLGPGKISALLAVNRRSVHRWLAAYRNKGVKGLAPLPTPGRPCKLTPADRSKLRAMLLDHATMYGYPNEQWTYPQIADLIRRRFGIVYHQNHIGRLVRKLG